ncbi:MAG: fumarylacetoacetate hydrolase family protein [Solirubrobacterales bacterium]|nr:fumarylacetoacetate hydrolase family protein [Solirubrobacterales bacterium]
MIRYTQAGGTAKLGWLEAGQVFDLEAGSSGRAGAGDMRALLRLGSQIVAELVDVAKGRGGVPESDVHLLAPIDNPGKLLAVAGGYYASKDAARLGPDAQPLVFCKRTDDIAGPGDPIVLHRMSPDVVDEIEIAIVIGVGGKDIPRERAMEHVFGYTICNDVSGRSLALPPAGRRDANFDGFIDWLNGKWMDGFAILGPEILTKAEAGDLSDARIISRVSGEVRVDGTTGNVNIPWDELIAFISRLMTLNPGDIITTGMPHGVGDEVFLKAGDVVEGEIAGLGVLRNPVVPEA